MRELMSRKGVVWSVVAIGAVVLIAGCVTRETYEAQVKRATNLQRLLADEEKKRNADVRNFRRQVRDLETQNVELEDRNRELVAQVEALQIEEARMREEMSFLQLQPTSVPAIEERTIEIDPMPQLESFDIPEIPEDFIALGDDFDEGFDEGFGDVAEQPLYHEVRRGDTLWSIAKRYQTTVSALMELNGLTSDLIHVGRNLHVGYQ